MTLLELNQLEAAEAAFRACLETRAKGQHPQAYLYLTSVYDQQQRYAEAVEALKTYLKEVPTEKRTAKLQELLRRLEAKKKQAPPS